MAGHFCLPCRSRSHCSAGLEHFDRPLLGQRKCRCRYAAQHLRHVRRFDRPLPFGQPLQLLKHFRRFANRRFISFDMDALVASRDIHSECGANLRRNWSRDRRSTATSSVENEIVVSVINAGTALVSSTDRLETSKPPHNYSESEREKPAICTIAE